MDSSQIRRIFVRAPNWVGDLVMATASFARIRAAFPKAEIVCGLRPFLRPMLEGCRDFDSFLEMSTGGARGFWRDVRAVRRGRFDLAIVLPNSLQTGLVARCAGIPWRLGYRQGRPGLMNLGLRAERGRSWFRRHGPRRIPKPMPIYYSELLDVLGLPPGQLRGQLSVDPAQRAAIDAWLAARGVAPTDPLVLLNAGASFGASKLWEPDRFAAVARHFQARGIPAVFLAGPAEVTMVRSIAEQAGVAAAIDPVLPLDGLKAMVARASLVITTDSGPRHVAVAFDVPVVCLMGPNDRRYTDYCMDRTILIRKELPCSPCQLKVCPLGHRRCMTEITVQEVIEAGEKLLTAPRLHQV